MVEADNGGAGVGGGGGKAEACPICLEPISGEAFLDQCFHRFCFHCILQWSEMLISKPQSSSSRLQCLKCPLCKRHYTSIIHDLSGAKFQRHYILTPNGSRYQRLDGHIQRQAVYAGDVEQKLSRFTNVVPKPNRWLSVWVQRELQAVMQEEDVETVKQHVVGVVENFYKRSGAKARTLMKPGTKTKDLDWHTTVAAAVQPFIFEHAEKFAEELGSFLLSGLNIVAYDHQNQQRASIAGQVSLGEDVAKLQRSLKERSRTDAFDLYDEDVDADGVEVMVGSSMEAEDRPSLLREQAEGTAESQGNGAGPSEAEHLFRGETSENVEYDSRDEDAQAQSHRHSQRDGAKKHEKKSRRSPNQSPEGSQSHRRHGREMNESRKRGRSSPGAPS